MSEEQQNNKPEDDHTVQATAVGIMSGILFTIILFFAILSIILGPNFTLLIILSALTGIYMYLLIRYKLKWILRVFIMTALLIISVWGGCSIFVFRR